MRSISFDPPLMQSTAWASRNDRWLNTSHRAEQGHATAYESRYSLDTRRQTVAFAGSGPHRNLGVSLAGATIEVGHEWKPKEEEHLPSRVGKVQAILPHASAAVLFFDHGLDEVG